MILQVLSEHYEVEAAKGNMPRRGWMQVKVAFALEVDWQGSLLQVFPLHQEVEGKDKKRRLVPQILTVPEQQKRSSGICPQFLCDNSSYILGIDSKGKQERTEECFKQARDYHTTILQDVDVAVAQAIVNFFANWDITEASEHPAIKPYLAEILAGGNIVFIYKGLYAHNNVAVQQAWNRFSSEKVAGEKRQCLVTGKQAVIARLHPLIKGVRGAQSAGASLVSFNERAFESHGRDGEQGLNSPIAEHIAFAYGTALNHLLADNFHVKIIGDSTVVYWAGENNEAVKRIVTISISHKLNNMDNQRLDNVMSAIQEGKCLDLDGRELPYDNPFYILGLAPNSARLSVRFFLRNKYGDFLKQIARHYNQLEIVRPAYENLVYIPLNTLLLETVNSETKDKDKLMSSIMAGAMLRSVVNGTLYPTTVFQNIMLRIKAETGNKKIHYIKAAMLKAYLIRNKRREITVSLDETSNDKAYVLGRLFFILEDLQLTSVKTKGDEDKKGNGASMDNYEVEEIQIDDEKKNKDEGELNATIRDRFFNSACATPAKVFPVLQKLSNHHLRKLDMGIRIYFEKQIGILMDKITLAEGAFPRMLSLEEQGVFILGYYHQKQKKYTKKNNTEEK